MAQFTPQAFALSQDQQNAFEEGVYAFDVSGSSCSDQGTLGVSGVSGSQTGTWNSGLQPVNAQGQYSVESYVIETLKDIAQKVNGNQGDFVTQEHVIALIAFGFGEGGNLTNDDIWNLWNNGIDAPDLVEGGHSGSGVQSFKSFDAGIEANARRFTEPGYSRLVAVLQNPNSTAQQFMYALSYYQKYPNNVLWAEASNNEPSYYQSRLSLVDQARRDYVQEASTALGPPGHTQGTILHVQLQFSNKTATATSGSSDFSTSGTTDCSATGAVAGNILQTAENYAWHDSYDRPDPGCKPIVNNDPSHYPLSGEDCSTPAYKTAWDGASDHTDCGAFVSTVMITSGVDKDYPKTPTGDQKNYVEQHPEKYRVIHNPAASDVHPGDILVFDEGGEGHTMIYGGSQLGGGYVTVDASWHDHVPQYRGQGSLIWMLQQPGVIVAQVLN